MAISYIITPKSDGLTNPYDDKSKKFLPSIIFNAAASDITPTNEPEVTITLTFSDESFFNIRELVIPYGVKKEFLTNTQVRYSGKFKKLRDVFNENLANPTGRSNIYLNYDNSTLAGANFFQELYIGVEITDSNENSTTNISSPWTWTPPIIVNNVNNEYTYVQNTPRIMNDIFQFDIDTTIESAGDDLWDLEMYVPTYDHMFNDVGVMNIGPDYLNKHKIKIEDSVGPFSLKGRYFGTLGIGCNFHYEIHKDIIKFWNIDVDLPASLINERKSFVHRPGQNILRAFSYNDKLFVYYKNSKNILDIFDYDGSELIHSQTITLDKFIHKENIIDAVNDHFYSPAIYSFGTTLLIYATYKNNDYLIEYTFSGGQYIFVSETLLSSQEYRGIYWINDKTFLFMEHDTSSTIHTSILTIYRKDAGNWIIYNTINQPSSNGISPFKRILVPTNTVDDYFISYLNNYHGDLYKDNGIEYELIKKLKIDYSGYNYATISMAYDSVFHLYPQPQGLGPTEYNYKMGSLNQAVFTVDERLFVNNKMYIRENNHGWLCHVKTHPGLKSLFKYHVVTDSFWGSMKRIHVERAPVIVINEIMRKLIFTPAINYTKEIPIYWTLRNTANATETNTTNQKYNVGGLFHLKNP